MRKAIISLVMTMTMVLSILVTIPMASRYSQGKVQEVTANHKGRPGEMAASVMNNAIYPSLATVFGSLMLGALAGAVVGKMLPRSEPTVRQSSTNNRSLRKMRIRRGN